MSRGDHTADDQGEKDQPNLETEDLRGERSHEEQRNERPARHDEAPTI